MARDHRLAAVNRVFVASTSGIARKERTARVSTGARRPMTPAVAAPTFNHSLTLQVQVERIIMK